MKIKYDKDIERKSAVANKLRGIWPVLVTPYTSDLRIDVSGYRKMIEYHLKAGCHGIYALCLSSEMHLLNLEEQKLLVEEAVRVTAGEIPVAVTGNLGKNMEAQLEFSQWAEDMGASVVMLTVPVHLESEPDIEAYFMNFAAASSAPLGIYECPYPVHRTLSPDLVGKLAKTERFFAYKETSCELDEIGAKLNALKGTPLSLLQANIPYLLDALRMGVEGSMNVVANWLPELVVEIYEKFADGKTEEARQLHTALCTFELMQRSVHPAGVKYLMSLRGIEISAKTRRHQKLTMEVKKSLDEFAGLWFDDQGQLRLSFDNIKNIFSQK